MCPLILSFILVHMLLQIENIILGTFPRLWLSHVSTISFLSGVLVPKGLEDNFYEIWKGGEVLVELQL